MLLALSLAHALAAQDKTSYLLQEIPQNINLNPAIGYQCKNYLALPLISDLSLYYRNSGFTYKQAFNSNAGETGDSIKPDINRLSEVLGNRNHIRLGASVGILGLGFEADEWYFSLNIRNRSSSRLTFNRSIIDARDGNWDLSADLPREIRIHGTGLHFLNYTEFAFGASRRINRVLQMGIRTKYLLGSAHLQTRRSDIRLVTSDTPIELTGNSDILIRGSLPVDIEEDNNGNVSSVNNRLNSAGDFTALLFSWNHGLAVDAGIIYEYSPKLTFSASLLNLGFIRWRKNVNSVYQQEDFLFQGIDLNDYYQSGNETDFLQALEDSVNSHFRLSGSQTPYTALIPMKLMAGASCKYNSYISLGLIGEAEILSGRIYPSLTINAVARPADNFSVSLSYSMMDRSFKNIGFGLVIGKEPVQFYLVSDNIPLNYVRARDLGLFWPYNSRTMNIRTGINVIFGCRNKEERYRSLKWKKSCPAYN